MRILTIFALIAIIMHTSNAIFSKLYDKFQDYLIKNQHAERLITKKFDMPKDWKPSRIPFLRTAKTK